MIELLDRAYDFVIVPLTLPHYMSIYLAELAHRFKSKTRVILLSATNAPPETLLALFDFFLRPGCGVAELQTALKVKVKRKSSQQELEYAIDTILWSANCFARRDGEHRDPVSATLEDYRKSLGSLRHERILDRQTRGITENFETKVRSDGINQFFFDQFRGDFVMFKEQTKVGNVRMSNISGQVFVGRFQDVVANLNSGGEDNGKIASALEAAKEAIMADRVLSDEQKQEHIEVLIQIGEEVTKPAPNKTLLRTLGEGLKVAVSAFPVVANAVGTVVTALGAFFR